MRIDFPEQGPNNSPNNEPLPEGRYNYRVTRTEFGHSKNKNTPQLSLWTKVTSGKYSGKTRIMNFYLTENALWKLQSLMMVIDETMARGGIEVEDLVAYLDEKQPEFSAWTQVNGDFNEFTNFSEPESSEEESTATDKYDDLPI